MWCNSRFTCKYLPSDDQPPSIEFLALAICSLKLIVSVVYIPPNLRAEQHAAINLFLTTFFDSTLIEFPDYHIILSGDFNDFSTTGITLNLDISTCISTPTRINNTLDHIFISNTIYSIYSSPVIGPPVSSSDHQCIFIKPFDHELNSSYKSTITFSDFRKSHVDAFITDLSQINWTRLYALDDDEIDKKVKVFTECFKEASAQIPQITIPKSSNDKAWITPVIKHIIHQRWKAFRSQNFTMYEHLKEKVKREISKSKLLWAHKLKTKRKSIWKIYEDISGSPCKGNIDSLTTELASLHPFSNPADIINQHLAKVFNPSLPIQNIEDDEWTLPISIEETHAMLSKLNEKKSCGPDGISAKSIKLGADFICEPICHIFNTIIRSRKFPSTWKISSITPLPKKRNPSVNDIRPISLLPILSKLFEKLIAEKMKEELYQHYGHNQYGFKAQSNTTTALIHINELVTTILDDTTLTGAAILAFDLSKAFDKIPHDLLISSLLSTTLPRGFIKLICNYLTNRFQFVKTKEITSSQIKILSGVPQGAVLSPILFCIFTRNTTLPDTMGTLIKYADDSSAVIPIHSNNVEEVRTSINTTISSFKEQCNSLKLHINQEKTQILILMRGKCPDELRQEYPMLKIKILGITFNTELNWTDHIDEITQKATQRLYPLRKLKPLLNHSELIKIYMAYIRSLLEYAAPLMVGMNTTNATRLQRIQNRALRIISYPDQPNTEVEALEVRRNLQAKNLYEKAYLMESHPLHHLIPPVLPRSQSFRQPPSRTNRRLHSFIPFTTNLMNTSRTQRL